ncbi:hypothetical protein L226DRAFT_576249 [Lentinus tigrinus ALCF2SS1-7]|uniref:uncharacterized protein n=1 Tax=Lentinus tigrinus ALCF2SS1-7 TaxID=1328758 RepID=UPI001165D3E9|nr:hypothetical protein L226DRAFT_576249 [Lentinus tigrinus ALCF2SS1-7]
MTQVPETGIYATSVGNMYESRSLISPELRQNYIKSVSLLENVPDEEKDWHPDTNNRVLDLLDANAGNIEVEVIAEGAYKESRPDLQAYSKLESYLVSDKYKWLPTDFEVSDLGSVNTRVPPQQED